MSQRIQWEALSISPEVSNARLGVDIDTLEALESQICRLLNDEEMAGDSLPAVARTISSPDDAAQVLGWDHEGRSLLIYTPEEWSSKSPTTRTGAVSACTCPPCTPWLRLSPTWN